MDMLYLDIDYMDAYKDFTVNPEEFPDFSAFVSEMKAQNIHLVPIIDAGVKIEDGYEIYEEGKAGDYFCKKEDGTDFAVAVWPGLTHLPDVLNKDARAWFGSKYDFLISQGIDGFWNDMNEPAIFYSKEGMDDLKQFLRDYLDGKVEGPHWTLGDHVGSLSNSKEDYRRFYHNVDGKKIRHDLVHNLYGYQYDKSCRRSLRKTCPGQTDPDVFPLLLYRHAPLWRYLDRRQQILVVTSALKHQADAILKYVWFSLQRLRSGRLWLQYHTGSGAALACLRHLHSADAQSCCHWYQRTGILSV